MRERGGKNNWKIFLGEKKELSGTKIYKTEGEAGKQVLRGDQEFIIGSVIKF